MVTGLGLAHEFGVCEPCGIDYSWLIHNPSVLLWADKIIIPKKSFNEQLKTDDSKLNKAINLVLNIANENNLIETLDIKKLYENEMFSFDEIVSSDSRKLKEFYPNNIHDGNPSVPGEIIIDGDAFCYAKIAAINASLIMAEETNSNCLFNNYDYKYLKYKIGVGRSLKQRAYEEIFSPVFPNELVLHNYAFCSELKCENCLNYVSCRSDYLKEIESQMLKIIEWRNRDEICQAISVFQSIIDSNYCIENEKELEEIKREFREKQIKISKNINKIFPKIKRWTNITSFIATPFAISSALANNTKLAITGSVFAGTSTIVNELMKYYENKNKWVGFINNSHNNTL